MLVGPLCPTHPYCNSQNFELGKITDIICPPAKCITLFSFMKASQQGMFSGWFVIDFSRLYS